nr:addiction module protein [Iningainema tapete]
MQCELLERLKHHAPKLAEILQQVISQISVAERIQLAEDLWDSILEQQEELPLSEAQQQELVRRLESYQKNPADGSSWEEVKKRLGKIEN